MLLIDLFTTCGFDRMTQQRMAVFLIVPQFDAVSSLIPIVPMEDVACTLLARNKAIQLYSTKLLRSTCDENM